MSKRLIQINGQDFIRMVEAGANALKSNVDRVNALNVFPVPDGDTGTNMNLTLTSGVEELRRRLRIISAKRVKHWPKGC